MHSFDVPPETAVKAIPEFARQAGIQIIAPADRLVGVRTPPIKGILDLHAALSTLLEGTGFVIAADDGQTIVLRRPAERAEPRDQWPETLKDAQLQQIVDLQRVAQAQEAQGQQPPQIQTVQSAPMAVPEQVLVTGSLIHGTQAVGVPVSTVGDLDFKQAGALTIADALKNVPALVVLGSQSEAISGSNFSNAQNVAIHGIGSNAWITSTPEALLMIDGVRAPVAGINGKVLSPSIVPQLALDRIDLLADGASATYGSDAVSGVINVILKRGFDGAITEFRSSVSTDLGAPKLSGSQLYGRTWDGGDLTVSYEYTHQAAVKGIGRSYFTEDFTPWGLDNRTPLISAAPAVVSVGKPKAPTNTPAGFSASSGATCSNCFSIPKGQNGAGLTWATIIANPGTANEYNFWEDSWTTPDVLDNSAALTFDQDVWTGNGIVRRVQFFAEGYYNNRRAIIHMPAVVGNARQNALQVTVPTINPYYPIGAPSGLSIAYSFGKEVQARFSGGAVSDRYEAGFNLDLLGGWTGKLLYSKTEELEFEHTIGEINPNRVNAALGLPVASDGVSASYTKPANVPYLNVFCDPTAFTCNDPVTLAYISSTWQKNNSLLFDEGNAIFDGPVFDLPGGTVRLAVGGDYLTEHSGYYERKGQAGLNGDLTPALFPDYGAFSVWAVFAQLNVPIVGQDNHIPLVESLDIELSGRYDSYSNVGSTKNPKVGVNWNVGAGLSLRGSWGTSFRAPSFGETSAVIGSEILALNIKGGNSGNTLATCSSVGGTPVPGSAGAILNPNCTSDLIFPGGAIIQGGSGIAAAVRPPGNQIRPQTAINWNLGFNFAPTDFLPGLVINASVWSVNEKGVITGKYCGTGLNDPLALASGCIILNTDPNFAQDVAAVLKNPKFSPVNFPQVSDILFIEDAATTNQGSTRYQGIDFDGRYDWDMGDLGDWSVGITGTYTLNYKQVILQGLPVADGYKGKDSGGRLRYRASLGWTGGQDDAWTVAGFMNYFPHIGAQEAGDVGLRTQPSIPSCFLAGNPSCASYGPNFAQYTQQFPFLTNNIPAAVRFDVAIGYTTGDRPTNDYLKNLTLQLTINNILNKHPNFAYINSTSGVEPIAFDPNEDPLQRVVSLVIRKAW